MQRRYISADEISQLFHHKKRKNHLLSWQIVSAALLIVLGIFSLVNAPAMSQHVAYWWESDIQAAQQVEQLPVVAPSPVGSNASPSTNTFDPSTLSDDTIYIPKIKTKAPIVWDVTGGSSDVNADLLKALERGVARYPQTALPDQVGNVFLTGHSSNYWWEKGKYKTVFALLSKLVAGDVIYVKYQGVVYTYRVNGQKVVKPTETSVLNPTKTPVLSLMTCTPTGTALYRRVVTADLVSPKENLKPQPTQPNADALQSVR